MFAYVIEHVLISDSFEDELPGMEGHFFQQHNGSSVNLQRTGSGSRNRENVSVVFLIFSLCLF